MHSLADAQDQMIPFVPLLLLLSSLGLMSVVLVVMGIMGRRRMIRPNRFFGIRTSYTYSSDLAWYTVHEAASRWSLLAGVAMLPALALIPAVTTVNGQLAATLAPTAVSLTLLFIGMWRAQRFSRECEAREAGRADLP
ncbi:SdpI family protein [Nocardiopsis nanhaiensis]